MSATAGSTPYSPAVSGVWTPGAVQYKSSSTVKAGGVAVIHEASCSFTFSGSDPNGVTVTGEETVTLSAGSTRFVGQDPVLVDGDSADGSYGNSLRASASAKLATD